MKLQGTKRGSLQRESQRVGSALRNKAAAFLRASSRRNVTCSVSVTDKATTCSTSSVAVVERPAKAEPLAPAVLNQAIREGHYEAALVNLQVSRLL